MEKKGIAIMFIGLAAVLFAAYGVASRNEAGQVDKLEGRGNATLDGTSALTELEGLGAGLMGADLLSEGKGDDGANMTKVIARATFEQMKTLDQQGKSPFDEKNSDTAEVRNAVERSVAESTNAVFEGIVVKNSDLKTIMNNTRDAKRRYLKDLEAMLARHPVKESYKNIPGGLEGLIEQSCAGQQTNISKELSDDYTAIARDMMKIQTPSQWVVFHKQGITHYLQGSVIFSGIAGCAADPLKGYSVAQSLSEFGQNSSLLQKLLQKMYTEVGL